jgi:CBS domain containing-hemolysin-like protein
MTTSRRTAGLGLLGYGIATPLAFMAIGSPGGDYEDRLVADYTSSGHWVTAFVLAYVGAFAALGLLAFARRMRSEVGTAGDLLWGLSVAATAAAVIGWFMVGGVAVAMAEGGSALTAVPHPVVYLVSEISNLVAVCATAFLVGVAALVLGARSALPAPLRVFTSVAGVCGILGPVFFPLFLFWLWAIVAGAWLAAGRSRTAEPVLRAAQPV